MTRVDSFAVALTSAAPDLLAYFLRRVPRDDAADLLGETMATACRRTRDLPHDAERVRMWLFGVARGVLLNYRRGERRRWALADRVRAELREVDAPPADAGVEVRDAVARLESDLAEVVQLVHWERLSLEDASAVLGIPASTARGRYARARRELRAILGVGEESRSDSDAAAGESSQNGSTGFSLAPGLDTRLRRYSTTGG